MFPEKMSNEFHVSLYINLTDITVVNHNEPVRQKSNFCFPI